MTLPCATLLANSLARFIQSDLSASAPHANSIVPRWLHGAQTMTRRLAVAAIMPILAAHWNGGRHQFATDPPHEDLTVSELSAGLLCFTATSIRSFLAIVGVLIPPADLPLRIYATAKRDVCRGVDSQSPGLGYYNSFRLCPPVWPTKPSSCAAY